MRGLPVLLWLGLSLTASCDNKGPTTPADGAASAPGPATAERAGAAVDEVTTPATPDPDLPPAEKILDDAAVAMGGRAALDAIDSFYYRGTLDIDAQNIHGTLEIRWKQGDFAMEQVVPGIGTMRAGKLGKEIWSEDPVNGRRRLSGAEAEQHAWASSLLLAAEWRRYFARAVTTAEREQDGRTVYDVELTADSGLQMTMSFDAESGLQVGQSFEQVSPMGRMPFTVRFEDYREVDGIKIAFTQVIDAQVQEVVQTIEEIELNAEIDEAYFEFPRSGTDVVRQAAATPRPSGGPQKGAR